MWNLLAQAQDRAVNLTAMAGLITAVGGIFLGLFSLWRARSADQGKEVKDLWAENRKLRREVSDLSDKVDMLSEKVRRCEADKNDMARTLKEAGL